MLRDGKKQNETGIPWGEIGKSFNFLVLYLQTNLLANDEVFVLPLLIPMLAHSVECLNRIPKSTIFYFKPSEAKVFQGEIKRSYSRRTDDAHMAHRLLSIFSVR